MIVTSHAEQYVGPKSVSAEYGLLLPAFLAPATLVYVKRKRGNVVLDNRRIESLQAKLCECVAHDSENSIRSEPLSTLRVLANEEAVKRVSVLPVDRSQGYDSHRAGFRDFDHEPLIGGVVLEGIDPFCDGRPRKGKMPAAEPLLDFRIVRPPVYQRCVIRIHCTQDNFLTADIHRRSPVATDGAR